MKKQNTVLSKSLKGNTECFFEKWKKWQNVTFDQMIKIWLKYGQIDKINYKGKILLI